MMLNQLRIVRWLETSMIIIVLPILLQKKRVKPKKAWSSWLSLLFHAFFASEKPGKDRKARKFLALLKSLHRSSKKSLESQDLILASRRQSVKFYHRVNSKNSQESKNEWTFPEIQVEGWGNSLLPEFQE